MIKKFEFFFKFQYFCAFFPPEDKIHFDKKKSKTKLSQKLTCYLCFCMLYLYTSVPFSRSSKIANLIFYKKKTPEFIFFFVFYKLERIFHLLIQKLPKNLCIILTKFFEVILLCAILHFLFHFFLLLHYK